MHPNVSCWQTPCGTLNGAEAGGPPTAPKLHKISVITLSTSPLPQIPHRRSKQATASQGFGLKGIFPKDLCFRWEKASFVSQQKKSQRIRLPHSWFFLLLSLLTDPHLAVRACVLHPMFPSVITHICPNSIHVLCNHTKCFPLIQGEFKLPVPENTPVAFSGKNCLWSCKETLA